MISPLPSERPFVPMERLAPNCSKLTEDKSEKITYRFQFGRQCQDCAHKAGCVPSAQAHRTILVGAHHEALQQRRRDQQREEFQLQMHQRNAIEGTISELVRGHGLRRAHYKGFAKVDLQNQLIAAACNIKRWFRKLLGTIFATQRPKVVLSDLLSGVFWLTLVFRSIRGAFRQSFA